MPLLSLYINNKAGGLIYHRDFAAHAAKLDVNDHLRLASTFNVRADFQWFVPTCDEWRRPATLLSEAHRIGSK